MQHAGGRCSACANRYAQQFSKPSTSVRQVHVKQHAIQQPIQKTTWSNEASTSQKPDVKAKCTHLNSSQKTTWAALLLHKAKRESRPGAEEKALLPCGPGQLAVSTRLSKQQLPHLTHLHRYRLVGGRWPVQQGRKAPLWPKASTNGTR